MSAGPTRPAAGSAEDAGRPEENRPPSGPAGGAAGAAMEVTSTMTDKAHPKKEHSATPNKGQAPGWTWGDLAVAQSAGGPASHLEEVPTDRPVPAYWLRDMVASLAAGWALYFTQPGPTAPRPSWRAAEVLARLLGGRLASRDATSGRPAWSVHCPICRAHGAWLTPKRLQCRRCRRTMLLPDLSQHLTRGLVAWQDDDEGPGLPPPPLADATPAAPEKTQTAQETPAEAAAAPQETPAEDDDLNIPERLATFPTDRTHAAVLGERLRERAAWVPQWGWLIWTGMHWERDLEGARVLGMAGDALTQHWAERLLAAQGARRTVYAEALLKVQSRHAQRAALDLARAHLYARPEAFDADPWCLVVANGLLDLRTRELRPHDPAHRNTKVAPVAYAPEARCPRWEEHLAMVLPNENVRRHVRRSLGLALVGACLDERLDVWYGEGANGKSTTARVLMALLGSYADQAAPQLLVETRRPEHPTILADLAGKRLVFSVEVEQGQRLAEALVKQLTGGDRKKARFLFKDYFAFEQTFSLFLLCNHRPEIRGTDVGIWRRISLVPWTATIPPERRRPQAEVVAELVAEGPGILNWLLEGLHDWLKDPRWEAPEVQAATEAYRADMDRLGRFLEECCVRSAAARVETSAFFRAYEAWCQQTGETPLSRKVIGQRLQAMGITVRPNHGKRYYHGLGLLWEPEEARERDGARFSQSFPETPERREKFGQNAIHRAPEEGEEVPF